MRKRRRHSAAGRRQWCALKHWRAACTAHLVKKIGTCSVCGRLGII